MHRAQRPTHSRTFFPLARLFTGAVLHPPRPRFSVSNPTCCNMQTAPRNISIKVKQALSFDPTVKLTPRDLEIEKAPPLWYYQAEQNTPTPQVVPFDQPLPETHPDLVLGLSDSHTSGVPDQLGHLPKVRFVKFEQERMVEYFEFWRFIMRRGLETRDEGHATFYPWFFANLWFRHWVHAIGRRVLWERKKSKTLGPPPPEANGQISTPFVDEHRHLEHLGNSSRWTVFKDWQALGDQYPGPTSRSHDFAPKKPSKSKKGQKGKEEEHEDGRKQTPTRLISHLRSFSLSAGRRPSCPVHAGHFHRPRPTPNARAHQDPVQHPLPGLHIHASAPRGPPGEFAAAQRPHVQSLTHIQGTLPTFPSRQRSGLEANAENRRRSTSQTNSSGCHLCRIRLRKRCIQSVKLRKPTGQTEQAEVPKATPLPPTPPRVNARSGGDSESQAKQARRD